MNIPHRHALQQPRDKSRSQASWGVRPTPPFLFNQGFIRVCGCPMAFAPANITGLPQPFCPLLFQQACMRYCVGCVAFAPATAVCRAPAQGGAVSWAVSSQGGALPWRETAKAGVHVCTPAPTYHGRVPSTASRLVLKGFLRIAQGRVFPQPGPDTAKAGVHTDTPAPPYPRRALHTTCPNRGIAIVPHRCRTPQKKPTPPRSRTPHRTPTLGRVALAGSTAQASHPLSSLPSRRGGLTHVNT
jgi:hypothetical protein